MARKITLKPGEHLKATPVKGYSHAVAKKQRDILFKSAGVSPQGKSQAKSSALKKRAGGMYGDSAMKRFTANKERKHKQWDREGK